MSSKKRCFLRKRRPMGQRKGRQRLIERQLKTLDKRPRVYRAKIKSPKNTVLAEALRKAGLGS